MGALATAARAHDGHTIGVIPKALVHRELADVDADELVVTDTMRERKQVMEDRADAFVVLPGGIGTLEEFFEAWTAGYLGMHDKPLVMLDPLGHYDGLLAWLRGLARTAATSRRPRWIASSSSTTSRRPWPPARQFRLLACGTLPGDARHRLTSTAIRVVCHERPEIGDP